MASKKSQSTALALANASLYSLTKKDGKVVYTLTSSFKSSILKDAPDIGTAVIGMRAAAAGKAQLALNITNAFDVWKLGDKKAGLEGTGGGLPEWVSLFIDPTVPKSYGRVGTDERRKITSHSLFQGVEAMVKTARQALKLQAERQKLIDEGKNPDDAADKRAYNKDKREKSENQFQIRVCKAFEILAKAPVFNMDVLGKSINWLFPKMSDNRDELNEKGKKLQSAVATYLFEHGAVKTAPSASAKK